MLKTILDLEKEEILEWLEEYEDGTVRIVTFQWKRYFVTWHGDFFYSITPPGHEFSRARLVYNSWEEALDEIIERVIKSYSSDLEEK